MGIIQHPQRVIGTHDSSGAAQSSGSSKSSGVFKAPVAPSQTQTRLSTALLEISFFPPLTAQGNGKAILSEKDVPDDLASPDEEKPMAPAVQLSMEEQESDKAQEFIVESLILSDDDIGDFV